MIPAFPQPATPQAAPAAADTRLAVPYLPAPVADLLLAHLPAERGQAWLGACQQASAGKADLAAVWPQLAQWLLLDAQEGLLRRATTAEQRQNLAAAASLYQSPLPAPEIAPAEWTALVNEAGVAARQALATATTALAAYAAALSAEAAGATAAEAQAASQTTEAAQAATETANARAAAVARATALAKALGKGPQAVALAAAKAAAGVTAKAATRQASRSHFTGLGAGLEDVQATLAARLATQRAAAPALALAIEAAGAAATYAALAAADAEAHLADAVRAQLAADDYAASYSLLAANDAAAAAHHAAANFVKLYGFATMLATNQPADLVYGRLADQLLALLAATPVATQAPAS